MRLSAWPRDTLCQPEHAPGGTLPRLRPCRQGGQHGLHDPAERSRLTDSQKTFADLAAPGGRVDHVSIYYNAGHPGVPDPHYHIVLWRVSKAQEQLVAK